MTIANNRMPSGRDGIPEQTTPIRRLLSAVLFGWRKLQQLFSKIPLRGAAFFGLSVFLFLIIYPRLFPLPSQINAHDEASHIQSGYLLYHGIWPALGYHPLVSVVFATAYAVLRDSAWWFIQSEWLIRTGLFLILWICVWVFGKAFRAQLPEWSIPVLWLLIPTPNRLLDNPSQLLFTIFLTCAVYQCVQFLKCGRRRHLLLVSTFLGFAFLARAEGLWALLLAFPGIAVLQARSLKQKPREAIGRMAAFVAGYFLPFLLVVALYMGLYGSFMGSLDTGLATRSYQALEAGQGLSYPEHYQGDLHLAGIEDSRSIYGTALENHSSVLNAFLRNPGALGLRVIKNVWTGAQTAGKAFGGLIGILAGLFAFAGIVQSAKERQGDLLLVFLSFSLFLVLYLPFFWLPDYFIFLFPMIFFLVAKGIRSAVSENASWFWAGLGILSAAFVVAGICSSSLRFIFFGLMLLVIWMIRVASPRDPKHSGYLLAAIAGVFLLMSNPTYAGNPTLLPDLQKDNVARAAEWLRENAQQTDMVAGWGATVPYLAERPFLSLEGYLDTPASLYAWLIANDIAYLYQDDVILYMFPDVYNAANSLVAQGCLESFPEANWVSARFLLVVPGCTVGR
jgi:hypothetical protein